MIGKIYKELFIICLVFFLGWGAFTYIKLIPNVPDMAISVDTENKVADILVDNILSSSELITSDTINRAVFLIKERLLSKVELSNYDYRFFVLKNDQVNAFATLGGNIFIYSGLLEFADNAEEVSSVIAHEIGHVEKRHVVNKLVKEMGVAILFSIVSGTDPAIVTEIAKNVVSTVFERSQETEADIYGLNLLEKASINPYYMATFFRKIKTEYGGYDEELEFLMSHPNLNKRIKDALLRPIDSTFTPVEIGINWASVKSELATLE